MKKIVIIGAGAIGGFIGARLALSGLCEVSTLARGATLLALQEHGWRLRENGITRSAPCRASGNSPSLGVQDLVIIAVKGPALPLLADQLKPMIGPDTLVMAAMNGVPWWFLQNQNAVEKSPLQTIDPKGVISAALPSERSLGCVVHASTFTPEPGLVEVKMGNGLIIGDPMNVGEASRAIAYVQLLADAGFNATLSDSIRGDIWYKLWGNMTINPLSAIAGVTADKVLDDALTNALCAQCMLEAAAIGAAIGCPIDQTPQDRNQVTRKLGAFKTSMLQDVELNRAIELDALVGVVRELGMRTSIPTPNIDILYGITRLFAIQRGLYSI